MNADEVFTECRPLLFTVAYEILGSAADAEDVLQDSYLRWSATDVGSVEHPRPYRVQTVTRQALNQLRAASRRREDYVGSWLPEPIRTEPDASEDAILAESVSVAMLLVLETLSPHERAVFVLSEVFGYSHPEIADMVGKSAVAVRQIAHRARAHVQARRRRFVPDTRTSGAVVERFLLAAKGGDVAGLMDLMAPDVVQISDGGGVVTAARKPIVGPERVAQFLIGLANNAMEGFGVEFATYNALPAVLFTENGKLDSILLVEIVDDRVQTLYGIRNPDKLRTSAAVRPLARKRSSVAPELGNTHAMQHCNDICCNVPCAMHVTCPLGRTKRTCIRARHWRRDRSIVMTARPTTLCAAFQATAVKAPDDIALRTPGNADFRTWRQYADEVRQVAAGLAAAGIGRGDTVALMMANRIEFYPVEVGAQHVGATSFSVYNTLSPEQLAHVFGNAGNKAVVCEAQYVERIKASGANIALIVTIDDEVEGAQTLAGLVAGGDPAYDFDAGWQAVQPDDVATLIYTSGTTGLPKGVESTHANLLHEAHAFGEVLDIEFGDRMTSYMPSAHIADRFTSLYMQEVYGTQITTVADSKMIAVALADVRPTIWGGVPRVWEKLKAAIEFGVGAEQDEAKKAGLQWALSVAAKRAAVELSHQKMDDQLAAEWAKADELVLSKLRAKLGLDQMRWAMSGAAPIPAETLGFFTGIGVNIAEIWGMSELTCVASAAHPRDAKLGTVGRLLPGMEHRIADDGEFLIRGPLVMKGYRKETEKTAEAVDSEGWLHTGDIITVDDDGFLAVVDRKKEIIINGMGKNISPAHVENTVKAATPLVGAIAAIGDGRPYMTALIVIDAESAPVYAAQNGLADASPAALASDPGVLAKIAAGVAAGNEKLSRVEQVKRFTVLPTFWEPGGDEVTLTMKLKRKVISATYADRIEALYAAEPGATVLEPATAEAAEPVAAG